MNTNRIPWILAALTLASLLLTASALAQAPGPGRQAPTAPLSNAFTYQGRLEQAGTPVEAECSLVFSLHDSAGGGVQLGSTITATVPISDGYFIATLNGGGEFGPDAFDGSARWLAIAVQCPGDPDYTALGRQPVSAAPYALYAKAAPWDGLAGLPGGFADDIDNVDDSVSWDEVSTLVGTGATNLAAGNHDHWGAAWSGSSTGLTLTATTDSDVTLAVINQTPADGIVAIHGEAGGPSGLVPGPIRQVGVWGDSSASFGVFGSSGGSMGVRGESTSGVAVFGSSGSNYGVEGRSSTSHGVVGESKATFGVYAGGDGGDLGLVGTGTIHAIDEADSALELHANDAVDVHLDDNGDATAAFRVLDDSDTAVFTVDERGLLALAGDARIQATETAGSDLVLESNDDLIVILDSNGDATAALRVRDDDNDEVFTVEEDGDVGLTGDGLIRAMETPGSGIALRSNDDVTVHLDANGDTAAAFRLFDDSETAVFTVTEEGAVTWAPKSRILSLHAVEFRPSEDGYAFTADNLGLTPKDLTSTNYWAGVHLPDGATVTRLRFFYADTSATEGAQATLYRARLPDGVRFIMASYTSSGATGSGSGDDDTIDDAVINNLQNTYLVRVNLPDGTSTRAIAVQIFYTTAGPW